MSVERVEAKGACVLCGTEISKACVQLLYCEQCSEKKDLQRKRLDGYSRRWHGAKHDKARDTGKVITSREARSLIDYRVTPELAWQVRVCVPFSWSASKNAIYVLRRKGHVALRREAREYRDRLIMVLKSALRGQTIVQNKLWLDIYVEKSNHKGDAVNLVDTICDAVKVATGLDDRWFSIRHLDWSINKDDPQLIVAIGQEDVPPSQVCSYCGRILEMSRFSSNVSIKSGRHRICRECLSLPPHSRKLPTLSERIARREKIIKLATSGMSASQIAEQSSVPYKTVWAILNYAPSLITEVSSSALFGQTEHGARIELRPLSS